MILIEALYRLPFVDVEALGHQRAKRAGREHVVAFGDIERRKPQIRDLAERPPAQEPAGLEKAQAMPVARLEKIGAIAIVQLFGDLLARSFLGPMLGEETQKVARDLGAQTLAQPTQRRARPGRATPGAPNAASRATTCHSRAR